MDRRTSRTQLNTESSTGCGLCARRPSRYEVDKKSTASIRVLK
jgi:hypothetical protein